MGVTGSVRVAALVVAVGACLLIWPKVSYWSVRYWIEPSARSIALAGLMRATDDGAWLELRHAVRSDDDMLRRDAALYLAKRGDRAGNRDAPKRCERHRRRPRKSLPVHASR